MSQKTRRLRWSALVTVIMCTLVAGLLGVQPASAVGSAPEAVAVVMNGDGQPDVFRSNGVDGQPAGNLTLAVDATHQLALVNGERIIVEVSDGLADNCALGTGRFIGFASVPTVTVPGGGNVTLSAQLASSTAGNKLRTAAGFCSPAFTPTTNDQLIITVVNAPNPIGVTPSIEISDVNYLVGSQAATGFATIRWASDSPPLIAPPGSAAPTGANDGDVTPPHDVGPQGAEPAGGDGLDPLTSGGISNAYITNLQFSPPVVNAIRPGSARPVDPFTLTETDFAAAHPSNVAPPGDPTVDGLCIQLVPNPPLTTNNVVQFVNGGTAAATNGTDVPGTVAILDGAGPGPADTLRIPVAPGPAPTMTTFTLSGVVVITTGFGPQFVHVFQCNAAGTAAPTTTANNPVANPAVTEYTNTLRILVVVVNAERYAGVNKNDTARVIGDRDFPCDDSDQSFAIITRNDDFSDALAANYISGQVYAPILLVATHGPINQETLDALHQHGVTDVIIMGGVNAVGADVEALLEALTSFDCSGAARRTPEDQIRTINTQRVQAPNRFGTARAAALFTFGGNTIGFLDPTFPAQAPNPLRTAILVNGRNFPDAMVAGPMAFQGMNDRWFGSDCFFVNALCDGFPILLADAQAGSLPSETNALITDRNIEQVIIVGGTGAVPQSIEDGLTAQGINVIRLGGNTRQLTAIEVAKFEYAFLAFAFQRNCCPSRSFFGHVALARGDFFTDALAMGPLAGNDPNNTTITNLIQSPGLEPILLTENATTLGADTATFLGELSQNVFGPTGGNNLKFYQGPTGTTDTFGFSVFWIDIAGGTAAVSAGVEDDALNALVGV